MGKKKNDFSTMNINEQLDLLKSILESSTEYSIIAHDLEGTILAISAGAKRIYGYDATEITGKNAKILYDPRDVQSGKIQTILNEVLQTGTWTQEMQHVHKDATAFNVLVTISLRKDIHNNPVGFTLISRDLTELQDTLHLLSKLKKSEKLLQLKNKELEVTTHLAQEANRLKSEFLANTSHELRTPLNGILGFAKLMYDDLVDPTSPKYKEFLGDIISSASQLLALLNDVLDLAKIEAGKMEFHPELIDLSKLLEEVKDNFYTLITKKNIQIEIKIDPEISKIIIDPAKLKQVFYNYFSNALKFTQVGGQISIRVFSTKKNTFCLEVRDTGIGIDKENLHKLFIKFQQLDSSSKKNFPGTGLGLALTKRIVEAQGGHVGVESTLGKGSTFYAILPCKPYHASFVKSAEKDMRLKNAEKSPTILVIERDSKERTLMTDVLIEAGYNIVAAATVAKAIEQKHQSQFDAIILDLLLPDMSDWEIIRNLRSKKPLEDAPPIIITAMLEQPISIGFKIHDFLIKPVKPQELLTALNWVGASENSNKTILIVDTDQNALDHASKILTKFGFQIIRSSNKISALLSLEQQCPDAVLLDPFMLGMDGFEFLHSYHQTERGLFTPVIIWTEAKLNDKERLRLKSSIQRVVLRGEIGKKNILAGLEQHLSQLKV